MDNLQTAPQIRQQILSDIQACEALLALLDEERGALRERDMDSLERILKDKGKYLETLENSASARSKLSRSYANGSDNENWRKLIKNLNDENLSLSWQKLKDLLKLCKIENEVNGKLLTRNQQIYSRLLEIVRGQSQAPSLYNASGSAPSSGSSNIVGEA